jgi:hypothetical protein
MKFNFFDLLNLTLFVLVLTLVGRLVYQSQKVDSPQPSEIPNWGKNRDFPDTLSLDERIVLTEQKHDYERTTAGEEEDYQYFLNLLKTMPSAGNAINVYKYNDDCFAQPVILKIGYGKELFIRNTGSSDINIGIGKGNWDIKSGSEIVVYPEFDGLKTGENIQGYSCSPLGLAGYLVIQK